MATKYVTELKELGQLLSDEGWEMRASIVNTAAERMERLENYITDMHTELYPDTVPQPREPHPDHCLCDDCVTLENMDERVARSAELHKG